MKIGEADFKIKANKRLHSKEHLLADDLSQMLAEPKRFAAYLGFAELYRESDLRALAKYVLEKTDLPTEARGKYFFAAVKGLNKKPGAKLKNTKRKTLLRRKLQKDKKSNVKNTTNRKRAR